MGDYATTTSIETLMIGVSFDTATTSLVSSCIDWAEAEIDKQISEKYDVVDFKTTVPPYVEALAEQLAMGYTYQQMSRGSKESLTRADNIVKKSLKSIDEVASGEMLLVDSLGDLILQRSDIKGVHGDCVDIDRFANYLRINVAAATYVPYEGATKNVDIGSYTITTEGLRATSGGDKDIGTSSNYFNKAYFNNIYMPTNGTIDGAAGVLNFNAIIRPSATNTYDCGGSTRYWKSGYFQNIVISSFLTLNGRIIGDLDPFIDNTYDLANGTGRWRDAWFSRNVNLDNDNAKLQLGASQDAKYYWDGSNNIIDSSTGATRFIGNVNPNATNSYDLGTTSLLWNAGYIGAGHLHLYGDNYKALFGASGDASIYYNATDFVLDPKEVGSGGILFGIADNVKTYWGQEKDVEAYYDATNFILNTAAVGTGALKLPMSATQLKSIIIDGDTTPLTAENPVLIDVSRTLQRTTSSGSIGRQDSLLKFITTVTDDDTITEGKANICTYYVFDNRIKFDGNAFSGTSNASWSIYVNHAQALTSGGSTFTIDSSADIGTTFIAMYGQVIPIIELNNAALDYTGSFYGLYGACSPTVTDTSSSSNTTLVVGVYGKADTAGPALDTGYGGYFLAESNTVNYGVYAEGATAAIYMKGDLDVDADNTYDLADSTKYLKDIYYKGRIYIGTTNEYIYTANAGYIDYTANTGHRFNTDTAITGKLEIDQSNSGGATHVLKLDQADVDEEFIYFVGTANDDGTVINSLVDEDEVDTATREGWIKVYVQDDGNVLTDQAYYIPIYTITAPEP